MPTIKEKLFFNFDGIWSTEFGLLHITTETGLFEEGLAASRSIVERKVRGRDKPHFNDLDYEALEFELSLAFEHGFDDAKLDAVIAWLIQDYYKPLFFQGKENKIFYCMAIDEPRITHTGEGKGYITLQMRCNSPFVYSPVFLSEFLDLSTRGVGELNIYNEGYGFLYPEISIMKVGNGNITIRSVNNRGEVFRITDLTNGEDLYINTEREVIQSDLEQFGVYRYNNTTGDFPRLTQGHNRLEIEGTCQIQLRYQFKYRF